MTLPVLKHRRSMRQTWYPYRSLKSIIFWDMTTCSPLSVNWRFGGTYNLNLQGRRNKFSKKPASKRRYVPPKRRLTLNGLHGVISQKIILFITTAVKTSNPTCLSLFANISSASSNRGFYACIVILAFSYNGICEYCFSYGGFSVAITSTSSASHFKFLSRTSRQIYLARALHALRCAIPHPRSVTRSLKDSVSELGQLWIETCHRA
jgi:hypothetical protein